MQATPDLSDVQALAPEPTELAERDAGAADVPRFVPDPLTSASQLPLPRLCAAYAGLGGRLKDVASDFEVEELPAYLPCGEGEHLYLWVEKRDVAGPLLLALLAEQLAVRQDEIGCAGVKDARAVTRQWLSVPATCAPRLALAEVTQALEAQGVRVLQQARHGNKLRTGHLRGNRFVLRLVDVDVAAAQAQLAPMLALLRQTGMANFYGPQRFGAYGQNVGRGLRWLRGAWRGPNRGVQRRFLASAVQSALFNQFLAQRVQDGLLGTVLPGEMMQVVKTGGPFLVEDVSREQARYEAREIVPTGPMFGTKMRSAEGSAGARELAVLAASGLDDAAFARAGKLAQGTRRPLVVWPEELEASLDVRARALTLRFCLPPGSYATVLVGELTGPLAPAGQGEREGQGPSDLPS